ncbi:hypothetical protein ACQ4PT_059363 [Festuca glaucescens]
MEAVISGVLGEFVSRAISFVAEKCREQTTAEQDLQRLCQLLLRISTIVEEAEGRRVENRAMVRQLSTMREQMFRGYYLLDTFRCRERKTNHDEVSHLSFAQSKFNLAKRFRCLVSNTQIESMVIGRESIKELKQAVLVLESMVADMKEFVIFLMSYPQMYRQPYGAYLYLDKYMFGRQMEREQAINFLLQAEPLGNGKFVVLPIVGPALVGKSTLVEHVCNDDRVRNHFSLILLYIGNNLKDETATTFRDNCVIKHQNIALDEGRSLVIIELLEEMNRGAWNRMLHSAEICMAHGSKIIITSRSEKTVSLGTTEALRLNYLSKEAYWYFFRMLLFGSTDPGEYPELTSIAMEIVREMCGSFIYAYVVATLLRANLSTRLWCRVLRHLREHTQKNILLLGEYPVQESRARYVWSMARTRRGSEDIKILVCDNQKWTDSHGEVPKITVVDLLSGTWSTMPQGKFKVLSWRSLIPPYYIYTADCEFIRNESSTRT